MTSLRRPNTVIPSLEAANQSQIDDLVQRNRTLEHTNKKLSDELSLEITRSKESHHEIQRQWETKQVEWKEVCEEILFSYRVLQKQLEAEVEKERHATLKEMLVTRDEKLQRIKRDFKIQLFQMKEEQLERKIDDLEEDNRLLEDEANESLRKEREKSAGYAGKLKEMKEVLSKSIKEKEEQEAKYDEVVALKSNLDASSATLDSKLQRTQLQFEGSQAKILDLERVNDELRRTNDDLSRRLDKWQYLETKGGEAVEKEHKQRIALELELRELKGTDEENKNDLAKEKRKAEKLKAYIAQLENDFLEEKEKDTNVLLKQITKLQKQNDKLKAELEVERSRVRPPSPQKKTKSPATVVELDEESNNDHEIGVEEVTPTTQRHKSIKSPTVTTVTSPFFATSSSKAGPSTSTQPLRNIARKSTGGHPPRRRKVDPAPSKDPEILELSDDVDEVEVEHAPLPSNKRKVKTKDVEVNEESEEKDHGGEEALSTQTTQKQKGKQKASSSTNQGGQRNDTEIELVNNPPASAQPRRRAGSRALSESHDIINVKSRKVGSRAHSKQPISRASASEQGGDDTANDNNVDSVPKRKKRKILSANPPTFAFGSLAAFADGGLDIPSVLSPVREDQIVPQRSTSSSLVGSLGNMLRIPFTGRKS